MARSPAVLLRLEELLGRLDIAAIEDRLGYTWREKSFLLQAFTHPSYGENRVTESYERLELLGDAVLDYLVTCHIYCTSQADPGQVTDIRSALVNNNYFAALLTDQLLDKQILHSAPGVLRKIRAYLEDRWHDRDLDLDTLVGNLARINESEPEELDMVEVPKVLGDVFEAVMGAVFLDSGHSLATVWAVYRRLCPSLDSLVARPPLNWKKQLVEKFPGQCRWGVARVEEGRGTVTVQVIHTMHTACCT